MPVVLPPPASGGLTAGQGRAIEIKTSRSRRRSGLPAFLASHPGSRALIVGAGGMPLEEFFASDPREWLP